MPAARETVGQRLPVPPVPTMDSRFICGCRAYTGEDCGQSGRRPEFVEARLRPPPEMAWEDVPSRSVLVSRECAKRISERNPEWATLHELPQSRRSRC